VASYDVVVKALIDNTVRRGPDVKSLLHQAVKRVAQYSIEKEASGDGGDGCCWRGRVPAEVEALIEDKKRKLSTGRVVRWDRCTTLPPFVRGVAYVRTYDTFKGSSWLVVMCRWSG
jgi:hypothetical protein